MVFIAFEIVEVIFIGLQRMESNRWWLVPNVEQLVYPLLLLVPGVCVSNQREKWNHLIQVITPDFV